MADHEPDLSPPSADDAGRTTPLGVPGVTGIDHVGVATTDLEATVRFHTDVLGLVLAHTEVNTRQGVAEAMLVAPGAGPGTTQVQVLAPLDGSAALARFLRRSGPGLQHLAYAVADLDLACAALRSRGVALLYDLPEAGTRGSRINFVHPRDAGGVLVELVEPRGPADPDEDARSAHDPAGGRAGGA